MVLSGGGLSSALVLLGLWFGLLFTTFLKLFRLPPTGGGPRTRNRITIAGIGFATVAVGSLFLLHLSWISPSVSQRLGVGTVKVLFLCIFWATVASLLLSITGLGGTRFFGLGTSLITGVWWFSLYMGGAISMGAPIARHPTRFLIPAGYVGWIEAKYGEKDAPALLAYGNAFTCKIPESGLVETSSLREYGWAKDEYFYYYEDGSMRTLKDTGWGLGGMIWGSVLDWQGTTPEGFEPKRVTARFYVGTEEQYHRAVSSNQSVH